MSGGRRPEASARRPAEPKNPPEPDELTEPTTEPDDLETELAEDPARGALVRSLLAILLNVGVLTALLVYFGWVRAEQMANLLGFDEAILDMTVDEYARRSLRSVFILPLVAGFAGLAWVGLDQWWRRRLQREGPDDPIVNAVARRMWVGALVVLLLGIGAWFVNSAVGYVAAPLLCATALLLLLYGVHLQGMLPGATPMPAMTTGVLRGSVAILVAVGLFWSAANYATVDGTELARSFDPRGLPGVEVHSTVPLDIDAPGVETACLGEGRDERFRYRGLRLLESTGGKYFLVSDGWTHDYGAVVVLPIESEDTRFTFVRDNLGAREAGAFEPCDG